MNDPDRVALKAEDAGNPATRKSCDNAANEDNAANADSDENDDGKIYKTCRAESCGVNRPSDGSKWKHAAKSSGLNKPKLFSQEF